MASDALDFVLRANLAMGAAILVVLLLRGAARRWFGARVAYALWLLPPIAGLACLAPARRIVLDAPPMELTAALAHASAPAATMFAPSTLLIVAAWALGALLSIAILAARQHRFVRAMGALKPRDELGAGIYRAEAETTGPAVVGVFKPLIVTPADFDARFTAEERAIVLAHERAHLARGDHLVNALAATVSCLNWFNPLVHAAQRALRFDQELACDAAVVSVRCGARRRYAEAMLKSHGVALTPPLGCAWPSQAFQPIKERIVMLKRTLPSRAQRILGAGAVGLVAAGVFVAVWAVRPVEVAYAHEQRPAQQTPAPQAQGEGAQTERSTCPEGRHVHRRVDRDDQSELMGGPVQEFTPVDQAAIARALARAQDDLRRAEGETRRAEAEVRAHSAEIETRAQAAVEAQAAAQVKAAEAAARVAAAQARVEASAAAQAARTQAMQARAEASAAAQAARMQAAQVRIEANAAAHAAQVRAQDRARAVHVMVGERSAEISAGAARIAALAAPIAARSREAGRPGWTEEDERQLDEMRARLDAEVERFHARVDAQVEDIERQAEERERESDAD